MQQVAIELILMRQLSDSLGQPVFLVDPDGTLLYYNEAAEVILGQRYEDTGEMPESEWSTIFTPTDDAGVPLPPEDLPLVRALRELRPSHRPFWIQGLDGSRRRIEVTALPLLSQDGLVVGAAAIFWERGAP